MDDKKTPGMRDAEGSDRQAGIKGYFMIGRWGCQEGWRIEGRINQEVEFCGGTGPDQSPDIFEWNHRRITRKIC